MGNKQHIKNSKADLQSNVDKKQHMFIHLYANIRTKIYCSSSKHWQIYSYRQKWSHNGKRSTGTHAGSQSPHCTHLDEHTFSKKREKKKTSKMQHHNFKAEKIPSMQTAGCRVVQQAGRRRGRLKQTFISCQDSGKMFTGLDMLLDIDVCSCLTSA